VKQQDARFEDGAEKPLRLKAFDGEDLSVISTMLQDAVFPVSEMSWQPSKRRFGLLVNRFRWEDKSAAERQGRAFERVRTMVIVDNVEKMASSGLDRSDKDQVLSLLDVQFEVGDDNCCGRVVFTLAGDGAIACSVECLEVTLTDVTRPYGAPSRAVPDHKI
jgi:hypothetical protein